VRSAYIPNQHGAWAFLGLPLVLGLLVTEPDWALLALAVGWVASYPLSYAVFGLLRGGRTERFRGPLVLWGAVALPAAVVLLVARPWLLWLVPLGAALGGINAAYARAHDERSLVNDLVFVTECAIVTWVTWAVGATSAGATTVPLAETPAQVWVLVVVTWLVLTGSTLHVKSLIRERRDPRYARASRVYAVVCVLASVGLAAWWGPGGWWLLAPFVVLAVRAFLVGRTPVRPGVIGAVELVAVLVTVAGAALAVAAS
jgi:hypothetical protein